MFSGFSISPKVFNLISDVIRAEKNASSCMPRFQASICTLLETVVSLVYSLAVLLTHACTRNVVIRYFKK